MHSFRIFALFALIATISVPNTTYAGPEDGLLRTAQILYEAAENQQGDRKFATYRQVQEVLDRIVEEYPTSDIAVRILLKDNIEGLDVAALEAALSELSADQDESDVFAKSPLAGEIQIQSDDISNNDLPVFPNSTNASSDREVGASNPYGEAGNQSTVMAALPEQPFARELPVPTRSEKEIVKDVQTELNRLGCNAGAADGVPGKKTNNAFRMYLRNTGSNSTHDAIATEATLQELASHTEKVCSLRWVLQNNPNRLAGSWGVREDCPGLFGRKVRVTGTMNLKHAGNRSYTGTVRASNGMSGRLTSQFNGNELRAVADYGLLKVRATLIASSNSMTMSGKNSAGCSVFTWKN